MAVRKVSSKLLKVYRKKRFFLWVYNDGTWKEYGIPQGTAMSVLLSIVYMIPFDQTINNLANKIGGYYRRYLDDILWISNFQHKHVILSKVVNCLRDREDKLVLIGDKIDISILN